MSLRIYWTIQQFSLPSPRLKNQNHEKVIFCLSYFNAPSSSV